MFNLQGIDYNSRRHEDIAYAILSKKFDNIPNDYQNVHPCITCRIWGTQHEHGACDMCSGLGLTTLKKAMFSINSLIYSRVGIYEFPRHARLFENRRFAWRDAPPALKDSCTMMSLLYNFKLEEYCRQEDIKVLNEWFEPIPTVHHFI